MSPRELHEPAGRVPRALCWWVALAILLQSLWTSHHLASEVHYAPGESVPVVEADSSFGLRCEDAGAPVPHRPHPSIEHKQSKSIVTESSTSMPELVPVRGPFADIGLLVATGQRVALPSQRAPPRDPSLAVPCPPRAPPRG